MNGNLEAAAMLFKSAGMDPKENRDERGFTIIGITDFLLRFIK